MTFKLRDFLKNNAVRDGHLRSPFVVLFVAVGGILVLLDLHRWHTGWVHVVGLGIAALGGYAAQACTLGIRPFEEPPYPRGWLVGRLVR